MIESEIGALKRRIGADGGLTLETAVKASELYARAGSTAPLLFKCSSPSAYIRNAS